MFDKGGLMFDKKYNKEVFYKLMDLGIKEAKRIRLEFERWLHLLIKCDGVNFFL